MTYKVTVEYGESPGDLGKYPSEFEGLDPNRVLDGVGAFLRDMLFLTGSRVQRLVIEREGE